MGLGAGAVDLPSRAGSVCPFGRADARSCRQLSAPSAHRHECGSRRCANTDWRFGPPHAYAQGYRGTQEQIASLLPRGGAAGFCRQSSGIGFGAQALSGAPGGSGNGLADESPFCLKQQAPRPSPVIQRPN